MPLLPCSNISSAFLFCLYCKTFRNRFVKSLLKIKILYQITDLCITLKSRLHCIMITGCSSMMVMGNIIITKYRNLDTRSKNNSIQSKCTKRFVMLNQCLFQLNMNNQLCGFSLFGNIYCKKGSKLNEEQDIKYIK